jgi:hypothetical protein
MTDESVDLSFLARQGKQILAELADVRTEQAAMREDMKAIRAEQAEIRAEQHAFASLLGKVSDAVTAIASTQERHSEILGKIVEIQANQGARLNVIEGRLAIIEKHIGLVQA